MSGWLARQRRAWSCRCDDPWELQDRRNHGALRSEKDRQEGLAYYQWGVFAGSGGAAPMLVVWVLGVLLVAALA